MNSPAPRYPGHTHDSAALVSIADLAAIIAQHVRPGRIETVSLANAAGRVLARPILADRDYPAFDKAMMDGYAVRAGDVAAAPVELAVVGEVAAGQAASIDLQPGQAMRINTGAPIPAGADTVIMREESQPGGGVDRVRFLKPARPGQHITRAASDCGAGQTVLTPGIRLRAAQLAAAATAGAADMQVYARPGMGLLVTGDELVPVGAPRRPGQIYDSNGPSLTALGLMLGADVENLGSCPDDPAALQARLSAALANPIVVVVGGMSMGTLDLAPDALTSLGVKWLVHGVSIRPGRPTAYGLGPDGQQVFGLPGNPVSCFVCFSLFVRIAVDGLSGLPARLPRLLQARLRSDVRPSKDTRPAYIPAQLSIDAASALRVEPVEWHGSGDPIGLGRANALLHQPNGGVALKAGDFALALPLEPLSDLTDVDTR